MPGDRWALEHWGVFPPRPDPVGGLARFFDVLGTPVLVVAALLLVAWFVGRSLGPGAVAFVVLGAAGVVLSDVLKELLGPTPLFEQKYGAVSGSNYPSGHVVYAVGVAGALGVLAWERGRRDAALVAAAAAVLMGVLRVADGSHLASDVVGGYALGLGWLVTATMLARRGPWAGRATGAGRDRAVRAGARAGRPTGAHRGGW